MRDRFSSLGWGVGTLTLNSRVGRTRGWGGAVLFYFIIHKQFLRLNTE